MKSVSHDISTTGQKIRGGAIGAAATVHDQSAAPRHHILGEINGTSPFGDPIEWFRLPRSGERSRECGLSRSTLNELILPGECNGWKPPVRSVVLKKRGAVRGIRLVSLPSLLDHLNSLAVEAGAADARLHNEDVAGQNDERGVE